MANPHSSVVYVEPNATVFSGLTDAAGDGETHDRAPDLEDYCIGFDIIVELESKKKELRSMPTENKVLIMTYEDNSGSKTGVRFMSGSRIGGMEKNNGGSYAPKFTGQNVLTSYYADMYITDLVDYGTTEMLGVKSVNVEYNASFVPVVDIKFTDVRGMSMFQPTELNDDMSYNGIRGFSKDNIAQSFFHAFFSLPIPKFTIILKGFYGKPVSYQVSVEKFDTNFNSAEGSFDVDVRFIGLAYSFMADISANVLFAAPYSDYKGEEYWNSQTTGDNPRFFVLDKNGEKVKMPRLHDVYKTVQTLIVEADEKSQDTSSESEDKTHEVEIQSLTTMRSMYKSWYESLYNTCSKKYGKEYCFKLGGVKEDDDYRGVIILTNGKNITGGDLSSEYLQFDESFRELTGHLVNAVNDFNSSTMAYRRLNTIEPGFRYTRHKLFKEVWLNDRTSKLMFDGFHNDCPLPKKEALTVIFGETEQKQQNELKHIYADGTYQYIDGFVIDLDYTDIKRRINSLIEDANKQKDDKEQERKELNRHMYEKLGWYPSIENFMKIVMAHVETLMSMMYDVVDQTSERTLSSLGVGSGEYGVVDNNEYDEKVAAFPRVTIETTDSDGITKSEDTWVGDFTNGEGFKEVDIVNGLFNAVSKIHEIEEASDAAARNINAEEEEGESDAISVIPMPLTVYDFTLTKNPYGDASSTFESIESFAGKICMRMFGIMCLNFFRFEYKDNWVNNAALLGKIEAHNFNKLNKITNADILMAINNGGVLSTSQNVLDIVNGKTDKNLPWMSNDGNGKELFSSGDFWLSRYRVVDRERGVNNRGVYPIQDMSFSGLEAAFEQINKGSLPIDNEDIAVFDSPAKITQYFSRFMRKEGGTTVLNTIKFTKDYNKILDILSNSTGGSDVEEYNEMMKSLSQNIVVNEASFEGSNVILEGGKSFKSKIEDENILLKSDNSKGIPFFMPTDDMYAGSGGTKADYEYDGKSYYTEAINGSISTYTLTECFGYDVEEDGSYKVNKDKSLFLTLDFYKDDKYKNATKAAIMFLMGIDAINYEQIANHIGNRSFAYIPNLAALQMGAIIALYYMSHPINSNVTLAAFRKYSPIVSGIEKIIPVINGMSPSCKVGYARHFTDWLNANNWRIKELMMFKEGDKITCAHNHYEKLLKKKGEWEYARALFDQRSPVIKYLTNDLMSLVCVMRLTVGASDGGDSSDAIKAYTYKINESQSKAYLDAFLDELRVLNGMQSAESEPTKMAADPSQTNNDMKIELYRYLKQLHDRWVSTSEFKDWMIENFFIENEEDKSLPLGGKFVFIDSFYNKVGNKLLVNPKKLVEQMNLITHSMDVNATMYSFIDAYFGHHHCLMRCIQNFRNLADGMTDIFVPIPYNRVGEIPPMPTYVVVYTYETSRNLNIKNSEFKDDGFMLNDEFETPVPIKSRYKEDSFYKIPAFGVSYGRQYQNYFKSVSVGMASPVMTEQAMIAKHTILQGSRGKTFKGAVAQDLYDIYSNQSYTCNVSMMGCAYIQPMMYFVLLNVPFFRGSYLISKVTHRLVPGDMTTEITGVRMSKYCNKMVEDIFTDEEDTTPEATTTYEDTTDYSAAEPANDCPYKEYPISNDENDSLTGDKKSRGLQLMDMVASTVFGGSCSNNHIKIAAAGIVGNMCVESYDYKNRVYFKHDLVVIDSDKFPAGGLCMWNDKYYNLVNLINNNSSEYGRKDRRKTKEKANSVDWYKKKLAEKGVQHQINFLRDTIGNTTKQLLLNASTPEAAAEIFRAKYEKGSNASKRKAEAKAFYNAYGGTTPSVKPDTSTSSPTTEPQRAEKKVNDPNAYSKQFFAAVQKSLNSTSQFACTLKPEYSANGAIRITTSAGGDKLAALFDIILNSNSYYPHVSKLEWLVANSPTENPRAIRVVVAEKVKSRLIYVSTGASKAKTPTGANTKLTGDDCNEKLMQSLSKKYGNNKNLFVKECPQFSGVKDSVDKHKPTDCGPLCSGSGGKVVKAKPAEKGSNIVIDDWDVSKVVAWITGHPLPQWGQGKCAEWVEKAIAKGGGQLSKKMKCRDNGAPDNKATNLRYYNILVNRGFKCILETTVPSGGNLKYDLQAGDVAIIGHKDKGKYHACLWTGDCWYSDHKQANMVSSNYPKSNSPYPVALYRYKAKES